MDPVRNLLNRLQLWYADQDSPIDSSLDACLPPPEIVWTLLALMNYRERVHFAEDLLRTNVQSALDQRAGHAVDIKRMAKLGVVPGAPEWLFELNGNDSRVRNRKTGETIGLDILSGPEMIQLLAFTIHSLSFGNPGPIERRLHQLFPRDCALEVSVEAISDLGLIHSDTQFEDFEICDHVLQIADAINAFLGAWRASQDLSRLAAVIGDWSLCREAALAIGNSALVTRAATLVEAARQRWLAIIRYQIGKGCNESRLTALLDAGADDARAHIVRAFADSDTAIEALYAINDDPAWCSQVFAYFEASPITFKFQTVIGASEYLLNHGYRKCDVIAGLKSKSQDHLGAVLESIVVSAPDDIAEFLHIALRSSDRFSRLTAAAILVELNTSEAREFLVNALRHFTDSDGARECCTALRHIRNPSIIALVGTWEAMHPHRPDLASSPAKAPYESSEGCESAFQQRSLTLRNRVLANRHALADAIARWCFTTVNA